MVENIESLEAIFQACSLSDPRHLEEGCVKVPIARSVESVTPLIAKCSQGRLYERRSIQVQLVEGRTCRRHRTSRHVHAFICDGNPIEHRVHSGIYRQYVAADVPENSIDLPALSELANQPFFPGKGNLRYECCEEDLPMIEIRRSVLGRQIERILRKGGVAVQRLVIQRFRPSVIQTYADAFYEAPVSRQLQAVKVRIAPGVGLVDRAEVRVDAPGIDISGSRQRLPVRSVARNEHRGILFYVQDQVGSLRPHVSG
jgi:hypothetical protein